MSTRTKAPFSYNNREEFNSGLVDWVGDVLYDILPEEGYEIRDEQIFTAFQIADAFTKQEVHLAEAGLGTGKTFAYLLSAIPYARFSKKPVVIACATTALQEQLAGPDGDIATLSKLLNLDVDARMAKDPRQYICDSKVEANTSEFHEMAEEINAWISKTESGARSEIPTIPDHVWRKVAWDPSMGCETCEKRGFCKLVKARESYRTTRDLIIVDHETFFADLWSREERIANGKMPILPAYSAVVFDEGHKILLPAAMQAGNQINKEEIDIILSSFEEIQGARESLIRATIRMEQASEAFFATLYQSVVKQESAERYSIRMSENLLKAADIFKKSMDGLLFEMQVEQELYFESLPVSLIQAYEGQLESAMAALVHFCRDKGTKVIPWVEAKDGSFFVVPRNLGEQLNKHLYGKNIPVIFTSATLSNEGDFDYISRILGMKNPSKATVGSPFDIEHQVAVYIDPLAAERNKQYEIGIEKLVKLLKKNGGRALVLTNSLIQVKKIRKYLEGYDLPFNMLYEDRGERGYLVRQFKEEETAVLVGANFWEGIDVPGEALTLVVIWQLPFPASDPLIEFQRKVAKAEGADPAMAVDLPEMGLKLKQGCGRLIRREDDHGAIVILDSVLKKPWEKTVMGALPPKAPVRTLSEFQ